MAGEISETPQGGNSSRSIILEVFLRGNTRHRRLEKNIGNSKPGWVFLKLTYLYRLRLLAHRRHEMPRILEQLLEKFGSFVSCMYPVDIFERLLVVDNIERLGIDRHFEKEINEFLDFVYSHWNEKGIGCNSLNSIADLEITALGFRLLRLHRYNVTPVVFKNLAEGSNGKFLGSEDQFNKEVANMLSLYQASELVFPGGFEYRM